MSSKYLISKELNYKTNLINNPSEELIRHTAERINKGLIPVRLRTSNLVMKNLTPEKAAIARTAAEDFKNRRLSTASISSALTDNETPTRGNYYSNNLKTQFNKNLK